MQINYIPIGDSLTIGHGAGKGNSWPDILTRNMQAAGFDFRLTINPAHSGWTSKLALDHELPVLENYEVNFSTVLIGANDMAKGVAIEDFRGNFSQILDKLQKKIPEGNRILVLNLPDFSATPAALKYQGHLHLAPYLKLFNDFIEEQAARRSLPMIDLYSLTQKLGPKTDLYTWDGLHPSARGYLAWEEAIRPVVMQMVSG